jgi:hypothetical protein
MARQAGTQRQQRYRVAIVGDGQTERIYFSDVRDTDRPANLAIFPDYPGKIGDYRGVLDRATVLLDSYNRVYALIDMDTVIRQTQLPAYNQAKGLAQTAGIIVLENNPCFEIWFLLHFLQTGKLFNNCDEVSVELRKNNRIPGYDKSEKFLKNARLYHRHKDRLINHAIPNANHLENDREGKSPFYPRAQTSQFFDWYFNQLPT